LSKKSGYCSWTIGQEDSVKEVGQGKRNGGTKLEYIINNCIAMQVISKIVSICNKGRFAIDIDESCNFALAIRFLGSAKALTIMNIPTTQSDGDEYPILTSGDTQNHCNWTHKVQFSSETTISIIRDNVSWEYQGNRWNVLSDVGLLFKNAKQGEQFWVESVDSLAGLIRYGCSQIDTTDSENVREFWSFKTDNLTTLKRELIMCNPT
jgi:hypothetical protein